MAAHARDAHAHEVHKARASDNFKCDELVRVFAARHKDTALLEQVRRVGGGVRCVGWFPPRKVPFLTCTTAAHHHPRFSVASSSWARTRLHDS